MPSAQKRTQRFHRAGAILLAVALSAAAGLAVAQERKPIPGTSVSLVAPKGFEPANGFAGLANQKTQASVLIVEMPAEAYPQLATLFNDSESAKLNFARQKVNIAKVEQVDGAGGEKVPLLSGTQDAGGARLDKWIALFKGPKTVMMTVQAPQGAKLQTAEVKALVASVSLGKEASLDEKLAALPFTIKTAAPFRVVDTIGGAGVLMTTGERNVDPSGTQPLMIAAYQMSAPITPGQEEKLSETMLRSTRDMQTAEIKERRRVPFAGQNGMLLSGSFKHPNGSDKGFVQYLAIGPGGRFVRLIVLADEPEMPKLQPAVEQTAASIAFAPQ
ncbi:hypothetical protein [Bosea sp. NBC_00550]|uniref:hypothetical protein n=1 Tax=Bosea sp. NBC_00550 TaxID=2969621 RepID=UPI002232AAC5|nr:hypothetical protein [Bosea sp. NBC_00550]UZF90338.1 hypothetical protein NWE53_14375 [Bosea sp. NBC_00550]